MTRATTLTALHDVAEDVAALDVTAPVDVRSAASRGSSERIARRPAALHHSNFQRARRGRSRMAAIRAHRRLHRLSDFRLARDLAKECRGTPRRPSGDRGRPLCRGRRFHRAALPDARAPGAAAVLARSGPVSTITRRCSRRTFPSALRPRISCGMARAASANAVRAAVAPRLDRIRKDAGNGRRPDQSVHASSRHAQPQQRAPRSPGRGQYSLASRTVP